MNIHLTGVSSLVEAEAEGKRRFKSFASASTSLVRGGGVKNMQGSVRGITHSGTPQTNGSDDSGWYIYVGSRQSAVPKGPKCANKHLG